jgi:hypothetical protein
VRIPDDVDHIRLQVADAADTAHPLFDKSFLVCGGSITDNCLSLPLNFTLIPGKEHPDHSTRVQLTALRGNMPVIDDAALFTFAPEQDLRLDFVLYAKCIGVLECAERNQACGPDATCVDVPAVPIHGDPDLGGGPADLAASSADMAMPPLYDLALADLSGRDLTVRDLSMPDLAKPPDLSVVPPDLTMMPPDLSKPPDLTLPPPPDLTLPPPPPDLTLPPPPDMTLPPPPDMAQCFSVFCTPDAL